MCRDHSSEKQACLLQTMLPPRKLAERQPPLLQKMVTIWAVCGGSPEGQGLALPGNDCLRYLVSLKAQGLGKGRGCLQLVFKGQEIPSGKMTSC